VDADLIEAAIKEYKRILCQLLKGLQPDLSDLKNMLMLLREKEHIDKYRQWAEHYITKY
jgi:hypothetical protein